MATNGLLIQEPKDKELGFNPTLGEVNKETDTVQGQMGGLLSKDSPWLARARASAAQTANERGLLNTSMAAQSGEAAAIDAALPIASADAGTYTNQRLANQSARNQAELSEQRGKIDKALQESSQAADLVKQRLVGDQAERLTNLESSNRLLLQTSITAGELYKSATAAMSVLMADPNTSPEQKQKAIDKQMAFLRSGLMLAGGIGNANVGGLLDFGGVVSPPPAPTVAPTAAPTTPLVNPHRSAKRRSAWEAARLAGKL